MLWIARLMFLLGLTFLPGIAKAKTVEVIPGLSVDLPDKLATGSQLHWLAVNGQPVPVEFENHMSRVTKTEKATFSFQFIYENGRPGISFDGCKADLGGAPAILTSKPKLFFLENLRGVGARGKPGCAKMSSYRARQSGFVTLAVDSDGNILLYLQMDVFGAKNGLSFRYIADNVILPASPVTQRASMASQKVTAPSSTVSPTYVSAAASPQNGAKIVAPRSDGRFRLGAEAIPDVPPGMVRLTGAEARMPGLVGRTPDGRNYYLRNVISLDVPDPYKREALLATKRYATLNWPELTSPPVIVGFVRPRSGQDYRQVVPEYIDRIVRVSYSKSQFDFIDIAFSGTKPACSYVNGSIYCENIAPLTDEELKKRQSVVGWTLGDLLYRPKEDCGDGRQASVTVGC